MFISVIYMYALDNVWDILFFGFNKYENNSHSSTLIGGVHKILSLMYELGWCRYQIEKKKIIYRVGPVTNCSLGYK